MNLGELGPVHVCCGSWPDHRHWCASSARPGTTVYRCPLPSCEWTHTQPPPDPFAPVDVPAVAGESLGEAISRASMAIMREWMAGAEQALEAHLCTHTTLEWVTEISRLNSEVTHLRSERAYYRTECGMAPDAEDLKYLNSIQAGPGHKPVTGLRLSVPRTHH